MNLPFRLPILFFIVLTCTTAALAVPTSQPTTAPSPLLAGMTRGVNVLGYDPIWKDPAKGRWKDDFFKRIKDGGFDFVRLNLFSFKRMDADNNIDKAWLAQMDHFVDEATKAGLTIIVDEHDYDDASKDWATGKAQLEAFWKQVAPRYASKPDAVVFELLNEPHGQITPELWNAEVPVLLAIIRQDNPTRRVIVGPTRWNSLDDLPKLVLPDSDRHLIATFHYYDPMHFTHQGAAWAHQTETGVSWGTPEELAALNTKFDTAAAWSRKHDRPLLLGEFGAYDKGPLESRTRWTNAVARAAEARGFPWCYWQFDSDFVVFDVKTETWNEPIYRALIPQ